MDRHHVWGINLDPSPLPETQVVRPPHCLKSVYFGATSLASITPCYDPTSARLMLRFLRVRTASFLNLPFPPNGTIKVSPQLRSREAATSCQHLKFSPRTSSCSARSSLRCCRSASEVTSSATWESMAETAGSLGDILVEHPPGHMHTPAWLNWVARCARQHIKQNEAPQHGKVMGL